MRLKSQGRTMKRTIEGTRLKGASSEWLSGTISPVSFWVMLSGEPGVASASAMELERPGGNIRKPE